MTVVAVTGTRYGLSQSYIDRVMDAAHAKHQITKLVHGDGNGVDQQCAAWAERNGVTHTGALYRAQWDSLGRRAGPERNRRMLSEEEPAVLIAFRGGSGTSNCVGAALDLGIIVCTSTYFA